MAYNDTSLSTATYVKQEWDMGYPITKNKILYIEDGILNAHRKADDLSGVLDSHNSRITTAQTRADSAYSLAQSQAQDNAQYQTWAANGNKAWTQVSGVTGINQSTGEVVQTLSAVIQSINTTATDARDKIAAVENAHNGQTINQIFASYDDSIAAADQKGQDALDYISEAAEPNSSLKEKLAAMNKQFTDFVNTGSFYDLQDEISKARMGKANLLSNISPVVNQVNYAVQNAPVAANNDLHTRFILIEDNLDGAKASALYGPKANLNARFTAIETEISNARGGNDVASLDARLDLIDDATLNGSMKRELNDLDGQINDAQSGILTRLDTMSKDIQGPGGLNLNQKVTNLQNDKVNKSDIIDDATQLDSVVEADTGAVVGGYAGKELKADIATRVKTADIIDNANSDATNKPLSAHMGKVLQTDINNRIHVNSIVTNTTTNDDTKVLSASMGKSLQDQVDAKVNTNDIVDDLISTDTDKPLSANQGKTLQDTKVNISDIVDDLVSTDTDKPLSANQGKVLKDALDSLNSSVGGNISDKITAIETEIGMNDSGNPTRIDNLESADTALDSRLDDVEAEITAAHDNNTYSSLTDRFETIEGNLTTQAGNIQNNTTAINTIAGELHMISHGEIVDTNSRIDEMEDDIDALETATSGLSSMESRLDALDDATNGVVTGLVTDVSALQSTVSTGQHNLSDRMTAAETAIAGKAATSDVAALTGRVTTLENTKSATVKVEYDCITYDVQTGLPTIYTDNTKTTAATLSETADYLLQNEDGQYFYWKYMGLAGWQLISGGGGSGSSSGMFAASLQSITTPDENVDYFVGNDEDGYIHYRYVAATNEFVAIGSLFDTTGIKRYNIGKSTGKNASNEDATYLDLYEFAYGQQKNAEDIDPDSDISYRIAHIELPKGGGGGSTDTVCSVIYKTDQNQSLSSAEVDTIKLEFLYYAFEKQDDGTFITQQGTYVLRKDNIIIAQGTVQSANVFKLVNGEYEEMTSIEKQALRPNLSFDVTKYCTDNMTTNFTLTVNGAGINRVRPCTVELVNLKLSSTFDDRGIHNAGESLRIPLTIAGTQVDKTIYITVDDNTADETVITVPHGANAAASTTVTIPDTLLTPGVHSINIKFSQLIGQAVEPSYSNTLYYDIACRDTQNDDTVLLSSSYRTQDLTMEQYSTLRIPYYLYVPDGMRVSIVKTNTSSNKTVVEEGVTGAGEYLFKAITVENNSITRYTVTIGCRVNDSETLSPVITFPIDVRPNQYSIEPVLDHLVFDFNPTGYINNPENEEDKFWVDENNSSIKLSIPEGANFDWDNGGWKYDEDNDTPYFCVKAGSRAQINYSLFQPGMEGDVTSGGSEFKCIFKATNVRNPEAVFLTSLDNTPATVVEYANNRTSGDQSTEEGDEKTLFSSYFNTKEGHVLTYKKGKVDSDKVAVVVVDADSLPSGADTSYIASNETFDDLLDKAKKKARKKNIDNYADMIINDIAGTDELPGYHGSDREALLAYVNKTDLITDKATAEAIWTSLQEDVEWANFRADTNVFDAVSIDMTQLIKNYAYTYDTEIRYVRNFASTVVTNHHDDTYANRDVKRIVSTDSNGDQTIVEIEINYERENNAKTYKNIEIVREVLGEVTRPRGLEMRAHRSNIYLNIGTLTYPYSEDDIIEFEYNVNHPLSNKYNAPIVMYEDGVPSAAILYPTGNNALEQTSRGNLIIGSDDCDIWIYRIKFYNKELDNKEILSNFYADALNPESMVDRYVRNTNSYVDSADPNSITPQSVAAACPDLRIIMIEAPNLTGGKNSFIKNTKIRCIYKGTEEHPARPEDNWVALNAYHAGQGTSSDAYGAAGRNLDIIFGFDGVNQLIAPKAKNNYRFDSNYKSTVITGVEDNDNSIGSLDYYVDQIVGNKNLGKASTDPTYVTKEQLLQQDHFSYEDTHVYQNGTGKVNFTDDSVPNSWFNIKLNIASSENTNNALLQKRYDRYLPYETPAMKIDPRVKNDMEFFNCVVFLREVGTPTEFTSDKNIAAENREWHFYGIGNIGDSKKTDDTRINIPNDPNEFCVEVSDNGLALSGFSSGVYYANEEQTETTYDPVGSYGIVYPVTTAQWENENNAIRPTLFDFEEEGGWDSSVEFRYDVSTKDGNTIADSAAEKALVAERQSHNKEMFARMYEWVVTAPDHGSDSFSNHLKDWFIEDSPLYWYLFTERYTMIDSRAKNTFYHYGKVYITQEEADGTNIPTLLAAWEAAQQGNDQVATARAKTAYETAVYIHEHADAFVIEGEETTGSITYPNAAHINNGYRFEMWDYDNDTALGINNNGQMVFDAGLEDVDRTANAWVYNEATNVFWKRIRTETESKLRSVYTSKKADCFNAENLITEFDAWQEQFAENLWRLDFERKYYRPYLEANEITYLQSMANGRKKYQRREFERNMCVYIDSKYVLGDAYDPNDFIQFRPTNQQHINQNKLLAIKLYSPMYINFTIGNQSNVSGNHKRGKAGETYYINAMEGITDLQNIQTKIYNASRIMELSGMQDYYPDDLRFSTAKKLRKLVLGSDYIRDSEGELILDGSNNPITYYNNNTKDVGLGSNPILEELDVRNCVALTALNLMGCVSLKTLLATGTTVSEITFATNGLIQSLYLPSTLTKLEFIHLSLLTTVSLVGYNNLTQYISQNTFRYDSQALVEAILNNVEVLKLNDVNWTIENISELEKFKQKQQALGANMQLAGTVHVTGKWSEVEKSGYNSLWPYLDIQVIDDANHKEVKHLLTFRYPINGVEQEYSEYVGHGYEIEEIYSDGGYGKITQKPSKPPTPEAEYVFGSVNMLGAYQTLTGWMLKSDFDAGLTTTLAQKTSSELQVMDNTIVIAVFQSVARKYPVRWFLTDTPGEEPVKISSPQNYGAGVDLEAPTVAEIRAAGRQTSQIRINREVNPKVVESYRIFKGWKKLPININPTAEDQYYDIYGDWEGEDASNIPLSTIFSGVTANSTLTPLQMLVFANLSSVERNDLKTQIPVGKTFTIRTGYDGLDDTGTLLVGPGSTTPLRMKNVPVAQNKPYEILHFISGYDSVVETPVQPMKSSNDAFTLAFEYSFDAEGARVYTDNNASTDLILMACYEDTGTTKAGFKLYYSKGYGPRISFGDSSTVLSLGTADTAGNRNIVVLRHPKGSKYLYVYSGAGFMSTGVGSNNSGSIIKSLDEANFARTIGVERLVNTDNKLYFGDLSLNNTSTQLKPGIGTVYWAKYWEKDLGIGECKTLASWNHETMTYAIEEYAGMDERLQRKAFTNNVTPPNVVITSLTASSYGNSLSEINSGVGAKWAGSNLQSIANKRIFFSLPIQWQSIITQSPIYTLSGVYQASQWGGGSYKVTNMTDQGTYELLDSPQLSNDYIYFPSAVEYGYENELYSQYESRGAMNWMVAEDHIAVYQYSSANGWTLTEDNTQYMNLRFPNIPINISSTNRIFISYSDSTSVATSIINSLGSINRGDIFINSQDNKAYIYVTADDIAKGAPIYLFYNLSTSSGASVFRASSGGWVQAKPYWTRSVIDDNGADPYFMTLQENGNLLSAPSMMAPTIGSGFNYSFSL